MANVKLKTQTYMEIVRPAICLQKGDSMERWRDVFSDELKDVEALGLTKTQAWALIEDLTGEMWTL